jgi:hypothetical protein
MIRYKQINEEWVATKKSDFGNQMKILKNPSRKEIYETGSMYFRGFIAKNGDLWVGRSYDARISIHHYIADAIKDEIDVKNSVPVYVDMTEKPELIQLGDYVLRTNYKNKIDKAEQILIANKWIKKITPNAEIDRYE